MFKWISGKLNAGTASVGRVLITRWGRQWADGKLGPGATKFYYWLSTHATHITASIAVLSGSLLAAAQMPELLALVGLSASTVAQWSTWLAYVAPILVSLKLATDQWHSVVKPAWMFKPWAVWLKDHAAMLSIVFGSAWFYAESCKGGGWCDVERWAIFAVGVVGANFGILPSAAKAIPPTEVLKALAGLIESPTPMVAAQAAEIEELPKAEATKSTLTSVAIIQQSPAKDEMAVESKGALKGIGMSLAGVAQAEAVVIVPIKPDPIAPPPAPPPAPAVVTRAIRKVKAVIPHVVRKVVAKAKGRGRKK